MGRVIYFGFCLIATVAILSVLSHYVIGPLALWLNAEYGWWAVAAVAGTITIAYPFAMRAERRIAIERGLEPPRHLFSRRDRPAKQSRRNP